MSEEKGLTAKQLTPGCKYAISAARGYGLKFIKLNEKNEPRFEDCIGRGGSFVSIMPEYFLMGE